MLTTIIMERTDKSILVPVDFTDNSEHAFNHALIWARSVQKEISLIHIVKKDHEIPAVMEKLKAFSQQMKEKYGVDSFCLVRKGDIFKAIKNAAIEINALIIVMGLHSAKRAIRVIVGSNIPFYLVQAPPRAEKIQDIVVPVDYNDKNRIQMNWVTLISKYFNSNINIIKPFLNSNNKNERMKKNMFFVKQVLEQKDIVFGVRTAKREAKFNEAIYEFGHEINADLIFIMSYQFKDFILKAKKFGMKIPVLCINPATNLMILPGKF
jgi:nucleotide-binding universal stress UspA family protein